MKKFFLIPLLACSFCAMAFAETRTAGTFAELQSAISDAVAGDVIELTADIAYPTNGTGLVNINKSITLDGKGHKLGGWGTCNVNVSGSNPQNTTLAVNAGSVESSLNVTIQNIQLKNTQNARYYGIIAFDGVSDLTLDNVTIETTGKFSAQQSFCVAGQDATPLELTIKNSYINANKSGYPAYILKPINATIQNSIIEGYCGLYFKYQQGNYGSTVGSRNSVVVAEHSAFNAPNIHSGTNNDFAVFAFEDDGINLTIDNCSFNADHFGDQPQAIISVQYNMRKSGFSPVAIKFKGDNTHVYNVAAIDFAWNGMVTGYQATVTQDSGRKGVNVPLVLTIEGGTYDINPKDIRYATYGESDWCYPITDINHSTHPYTGAWTYATIDETKFAINQVKQGDKTLYRVTKKPEETKTINDNVEGQGAGKNAETAFNVTTDTQLSNETTEVGYICVDNANLTVGKASGEDKDQVLVVNNGLDVKGNAQVVVKAGSTLVVGEGGIVSEKAENIVLEASEGDDAVNFLLDPEITVNTTPMATYKFKSQARKKEGMYIWQRFGVPTFNGATSMTWTGSVGTALFKFDYNTDSWVNIVDEVKVPTELPNHRFDIVGQPFQCYNMTVNEDVEVEYTFQGPLMGNTNMPLSFQWGWNYYANSYTAPIDVRSFMEEIYKNFEGVSASVYVYQRNPDGTTNWTSVNRTNFIYDQTLKMEIKPMQAFVLYLTSGEAGEKGSINYKENVFDPFMSEPSLAPARENETMAYNGAVFTITDGVQSEELSLLEGDEFSDEFDNGYDADKLDNENNFSLYCIVGEKKLSTVATNSLEDKAIAFDNKKAGEFTLKVTQALGTTVKIYDAVEKKLIELTAGAEYKFNADAINDPARFIINPSDAPAGIDNTEVVVKASKFIENGQLYIRRGGNVYTIQGQEVK